MRILDGHPLTRGAPITAVRVCNLRAFLDAHGAADATHVRFDRDTRVYPIDVFVATEGARP